MPKPLAPSIGRRRVSLGEHTAVRQYAIGKGHSVSVLWRGGEVDSIFGFASEHKALEWIREKSQTWIKETNRDKREE